MSNQIEAEEAKKKKKNSSKKKSRFSDEQIRLLESIFESETKLEPRKKLQLARELGLQPRQVAIWFQNRRARWKSKQIEQEYTALRANYEKLACCFDSLKNEKQSLLMQLQKLTKLLGQPCEGNGPCKDLGESNTAMIASDTQGNIIKSELEAKQELDNRKFLCSSDKIKFYGDERHQLLSNDEYRDNEWYSLDSGSQFDLSSSSSQWFNFWT